jgi:hypothetical protein
MRKIVWSGLALAMGLALLAGPSITEARRSNSATFTPNVRMGQWRTSLEERTVRTLTVEVQRVSGSDRTFINARFGREGHTFEGGRRVYLRGSDWTTVTWNVNQAPNGRELILNAYDGQVQLRRVHVQY